MVNLLFCTASEWLESLFTFNFISDVTTAKKMSKSKVQLYLGGKCKESEDCVTVTSLDQTVSQNDI